MIDSYSIEMYIIFCFIWEKLRTKDESVWVLSFKGTSRKFHQLFLTDLLQYSENKLLGELKIIL